MKYALGLIESYGNEFDKNLVALEKALMKAQEQRELIWFSFGVWGKVPGWDWVKWKFNRVLPVKNAR